MLPVLRAKQNSWNDASRFRRAVCGVLSLLIFPVVTIASLSIGLIALRNVGGERGMGYGILGVLVSWYASILSVFFAAVALLRRERPNWPGIIGLSISLAPALLGFCFYLAEQF